ncbi:MAG: rRNA maturation RNase YbeY [Bacteroidota bacterium]
MISIYNAHPRIRLPREPFRRLVRLLLRQEKTSSSELSIVFVGHGQIRPLNARFLHHNRTTDVISFPLGEGRRLEGEIYVNLDQAREQASAYRTTFSEEVARLVVHGVLHLLGYDDHQISEAARMHARENELLGRYWRGLRRHSMS